LQNLDIFINKWTEDIQSIEYLEGLSSTIVKYKLYLPDTEEDTITVSVYQDHVFLYKKKIEVQLSVPEHTIKLDKKEEEFFVTHIFDNREENNREIIVEYSIDKDGETYYADIQKEYIMEDNEIYHKIEKLPVVHFPKGEYEVKSVFKEKGKIIGQSVTVFSMNNDYVAQLDAQVTFSIVMAIILVYTVYVIIRVFL